MFLNDILLKKKSYFKASANISPSKFIPDTSCIRGTDIGLITCHFAPDACFSITSKASIASAMIPKES